LGVLAGRDQRELLERGVMVIVRSVALTLQLTEQLERGHEIGIIRGDIDKRTPLAVK